MHPVGTAFLAIEVEITVDTLTATASEDLLTGEREDFRLPHNLRFTEGVASVKCMLLLSPPPPPQLKKYHHTA